MRKAQSTLEYLFVIALALILILVLFRTFLDPRVGTLKKVGNQQGYIESDINETINNFTR